MTAGQREQDEAAGGPERRELRLADGTVVTASVAARHYSRSHQLLSLSEGDSTKYQKSTARSFLTLESPQKTENKAR